MGFHASSSRRLQVSNEAVRSTGTMSWEQGSRVTLDFGVEQSPFEFGQRLHVTLGS